MTIFQKIIKKEIPANIIYEDEFVIAFLDINPKTTGHTLVVPKSFSRNLITINDNDLEILFKKSREIAIKLIKTLEVDGFQLHVNNEASSKQEVFHTHIHIIPTECNKKINPKEFKLI